jgi:hypothetical protein
LEPWINPFLWTESVAGIDVLWEGHRLNEATSLIVNEDSPGRPPIVGRQRSHETVRSFQSPPQHLRTLNLNAFTVENKV